MYLVINTIEDDKFSLALVDANGVFIKSVVKKGKFIQAEYLLPEIDKLVKTKYSYKDIKGIVIARGPGGFTSIRMGIVTANTISYALDIPIVGLKANEFKDFKGLAKKGVMKILQTPKKEIVIPFYGREPNITKAKKKKY